MLTAKDATKYEVKEEPRQRGNETGNNSIIIARGLRIFLFIKFLTVFFFRVFFSNISANSFIYFAKK